MGTRPNMVRRALEGVISWAPVVVLSWDYVAGLSYQPDADLALIGRRWYSDTAKRGDLVALSPTVVRRVVATAGDVVTPRDDVQRLTTVPHGFLWLEPDVPSPHYRHPHDSTHNGPLPVALVTGHVALTLPHLRPPSPTPPHIARRVFPAE